MHVAVTAVGADRPGIVAAVTQVLFDQGANIEGSRMAILGGHFAMVLIVSTPADATALEEALGAPARDLELVCSVRPVSDVPAEHAAGAPYVVSVYGADRPGIVWRVSQLLADRRVNIIDLATHVVGSVYVMILEVTLPAGADAAAIAGELKALADELGIDVSMRPVEPETL
jgi:glycine cleavage system transcriptional repressor